MLTEEDKAEFWEEKYLSDQTPWDLGQPNPAFIQLLKDNKFLQPCKILIPGCGKGYDAVAAAKFGYDVTALDFSNKAIYFAKELAEKENLRIKFLVKNIFDLDESFNKSFDAIYDYTFFCAINPDRRSEYSEKCFELLKVGGKFAAVLFPVEKRDGGPPFGVDLSDVYRIFSKKFRLCLSSKNIDSIGPRKGREVLHHYIKRDI
jgi:SAM-dependent methyltransferase